MTDSQPMTATPVPPAEGIVSPLQLANLCYYMGCLAILLTVVVIPLEWFMMGSEDFATGLTESAAPFVLRLTPLLAVLGAICVSTVAGLRGLKLLPRNTAAAGKIYGAFIFAGIALSITSSELGQIYGT